MGEGGETIVSLFSPLNQEMDGSLWDWFGQNRWETEARDDMKIQLAIKRPWARIYVRPDTRFLVIRHGKYSLLRHSP